MRYKECLGQTLRPFLVLLVLLSFAAPTGLAQSTPPPDEAAADAAAPLRVMTFNIRYDNPDDGPHAWPHRQDRVAGTIRFYEADLVGVQEALRGQMDDLAARLPDHAWLGVGRDADGGGEYSAIFYREDRFDVLDHGTFWLSETPEVPGSRSWDAAITRIATWARFRDRRTDETFYHFNTHFDHRGEQARTESARLLLRRIGALAGDAPVVVTGDFNFTEAAEGYDLLTAALEDAFYTTEAPHHGPEGTYQGFEVTGDPGRRIDYIFTSEDVRVLRSGTLSDSWQGAYASDHLPVLAVVLIE